MIIGVGTDITELSRIDKLLRGAASERFLSRILTDAERVYASQRKKRLTEFAAGRFSAKEAVVKALGCGIGEKVGFHDIEILPDPLGKPICSISQAALHRLGINGRVNIHISISHSETAAISFAVLEQ